MKTVLMILGVMVAGLAQAQVTKFNCANSNHIAGFNGTLDASGFDPSSGYAELRQASLLDGYITANLTCVDRPTQGSSGHYSCVGYAFNIGDSGGIVEVLVDINHAANAAKISWSQVKPNDSVPHFEGGSWNCSLTRH